MSLDIDAIKQAYQMVRNAVKRGNIVFYYASEFILRCDPDGNEVVYTFPLEGDPGHVILMHGSLVDAFCEMMEKEGFTVRLMDWDEYGQRQHDRLMKRLRDESVAQQVWDEALYDFTVGGFGLSRIK